MPSPAIFPQSMLAVPTIQTPLEARWPVLVAVAASALLLGMLPDRIRLFPPLINWALGLTATIPIIGVALKGTHNRLWQRLERIGILILFVVMGVAMTSNIANIITAMIERPADISGLQLLSSSVGVWVTNVIIFALLYWQIDRGGPEKRVNHTGIMPDWLFPQESAPSGEVVPDWRPTFVDYLYLAYSTCTAFSTTDAMPLTPRAKLLMMMQSAFSLMTVVVVASRAINILGS
jgi:hypothetical protein